MAIASEIIVHSTAQGAYIFRMYRFGHNHYLLLCFCILVLLELGFGFRWVGRVAINRITAVQLVNILALEIKWDITSFFTISAFVDVFIAVSMTYQLVRSRSNGLKQTKHLIDKIIRLTIRERVIDCFISPVFNVTVPEATGMLTSSLAIVIVLLWNLDKPTSFTWAGMCALEPCCYAAGLLTLLNARRSSLNTVDSGHLSLPMAVIPETPRYTGMLSSTDTATTAVTAMVDNLSAPLHKVVQIIRHSESRDMDIDRLKSSLPFGSES
ncbi:hypothetical protein BD779DRAFT_1674978 [Infundibulicybe gibba]|nr:hypothetical protein BD779DRAFT_1674978 [Infundibulicybe gibba]